MRPGTSQLPTCHTVLAKHACPSSGGQGRKPQRTPPCTCCAAHAKRHTGRPARPRAPAALPPLPPATSAAMTPIPVLSKELRGALHSQHRRHQMAEERMLPPRGAKPAARSFGVAVARFAGRGPRDEGLCALAAWPHLAPLPPQAPRVEPARRAGRSKQPGV